MRCVARSCEDAGVDESRVISCGCGDTREDKEASGLTMYRAGLEMPLPKRMGECICIRVPRGIVIRRFVIRRFGGAIGRVQTQRSNGIIRKC